MMAVKNSEIDCFVVLGGGVTLRWRLVHGWLGWDGWWGWRMECVALWEFGEGHIRHRKWHNWHNRYQIKYSYINHRFSLILLCVFAVFLFVLCCVGPCSSKFGTKGREQLCSTPKSIVALCRDQCAD
jgi:hypothetical protein